MKELSIEEKAKAYDELFVKAKQICNKENDVLILHTVEELFPELKESEDERIRKAIISAVNIYCTEYIRGTKVRNDMLAWLEKQGEQSQYWEPSEEQLEALDYAYNSCPDTERGNYYEGVLGTIIDDLHKLSEKQGEQKVSDEVEPKFKVGDKIYLKPEYRMPDDDTPIVNTVKEIIRIDDKHYRFDGSYIFIEDQDKYELVEQNPVDKDEPKFKVGDWIVDNCHNVWKIEGILNQFYLLECVEGGESRPTIEWVNKTFHLWTIADAKPGDVLCCENSWTCIFKTLVNDETFSSYCFMDKTKWFCETGSECHTLKEDFVKAYNGKIYPATKEQRDTLMKAMADAGWEFDFKKKELKKIEDEPENYKQQVMSEMTDFFKDYIRPNPAWSEEDEVKINRIVDCLENLNVADNDILLKDVDWLKSLKDRVQPQTKQEWGKEDERNIQTVDSVIFYDKNLPEDTCMRLRNWLKSLRPQNRWKPSDEQMEALKGVQDGVFRLGILESLYQDLKKLREE